MNDAPRPSTVDTVARTLRPSRRPDVAAGLLLGVLLVGELPGIDADHRRVIGLAMRDAALAVHPEADRVLAELLAAPAGEYVDEDDSTCSTCDGDPVDRIVALGAELDAANARCDRLTTELAGYRRREAGAA
ncbi:hypothetical protein [Amycolatopsis sp. CA-128772]|uniref:hypothetical protein n=1 Tax=Amycolatopsis sp. CA-128772 TaxID=2073159 RepID=UPI000CCFF652|nr:hypothetical protein [Amycolatopsis sp. CA-128772]